ncbi:MAG: M18 family aminopeptidase [Trueperella sp.]|nr:M18 family aminopeptidase [Trueperella sp.]
MNNQKPDMRLPVAEQSAVDFAANFADFIATSPTSYHASAEISRQLAAAGFTEQDEAEAWSGHRRGYVVRGGAVIAWQLPEKFAAFRIVGCHTDSPSFKLKPNPESATKGFAQVNVEVYGGPLLNSWLNRDLGVAGQLTEINGKTHLVSTAGPVMTIPQLAPHLDRSVNDRLELSRQRDYHPIWALGEAEFLPYLCELAGIDAQRVAGTDLYAYDVAAPECFGGETGADFFAAARQDNLSSVYAGLRAFLDLAASDAAPAAVDALIFAAFDHEEVGSSTYSGAAGPLLEQVMERIALAAGATRADFLQLLANSSCVSADAGHSINPNKPEKHDPDHQPVLGGGPLVKLNANQRYATEANGIAIWLQACAAAGVATQEFVSNNDVPCGSTIGPATASRLGVVTVDVGVPLLSMHSVRELSNPRDLRAMAQALKGYWEGA